MNSKERQLRGLVRHEAKGLRRHATEEEKGNLDFSTLYVDHRTKCVYGQMTGNCSSDRAVELIRKCASRVFPAGNGGVTMSQVADKEVNGSPINAYRNNYWSPIEAFIAKQGNGAKNNKILLSFIKGETDELNFI